MKISDLVSFMGKIRSVRSLIGTDPIARVDDATVASLETSKVRMLNNSYRIRLGRFYEGVYGATAAVHLQCTNETNIASLLRSFYRAFDINMIPVQNLAWGYTVNDFDYSDSDDRTFTVDDLVALNGFDKF